MASFSVILTSPDIVFHKTSMLIGQDIFSLKRPYPNEYGLFIFSTVSILHLLNQSEFGILNKFYNIFDFRTHWYLVPDT